MHEKKNLILTHNADKVAVVIKMFISGLCSTKRFMTGIAALPSPDQEFQQGMTPKKLKLENKR